MVGAVVVTDRCLGGIQRHYQISVGINAADAPGDQPRPLGQGLTNRHITAQRYLTEKTVKKYVSTRLHKLRPARRSRRLRHPPAPDQATTSASSRE